MLGAGAWGTALAVHAAARHEVAAVGARRRRRPRRMQVERENRALPARSVACPRRCGSRAEPATARCAMAARSDLVIIATPMAGLRADAAALREHAAARCSGCARASRRHRAAWRARPRDPAEVRPALRAGVLSGPSFALEVARGQPTALVAASERCRVARRRWWRPSTATTLRVYANDDPVGVEVGGAVKNVLAIATGMADGLALGLNARAALITRGLAEMTRLGRGAGRARRNLHGPVGLGDLVLTATGDLSRNRQVGLLLAQGQSPQQACDSLGHVAEGVYCARTVVRRAPAPRRRDADLAAPWSRCWTAS